MNRPDYIPTYDPLDLKLGIKSSLPHVKSTLALAILLWESSDNPSVVNYSIQKENEIVLPENMENTLFDCVDDICGKEGISFNELIANVNQNQLFKSQLEALIVAFELIWKLAKVEFVDSNKAASAERTGGIRYPKKLSYSVNIDVIHALISGDTESYFRVLLAWMGMDVAFDDACETRLMRVLTALSETAVFRLEESEREVIFNQNSIYKKIIETNDVVDINGDKESKGPLRILKSTLSEGLNPYLSVTATGVGAEESNESLLGDYQKRVDTYHRLSATKVINKEETIERPANIVQEELEKNRLAMGTNILLYGVPGSGKSHTISTEYCNDEEKMERLVFHPDFMYSDFIGQILPVVKKGEDGKENKVVYEFTPGPFTKIMKKAYEDPANMYYLVIEEINRGNAPAIFGDIFQLLDRITEDGKGYPIGTSEYPVSNESIAKEVYGDKNIKVRIPSNLTVIATMNTSDQNVFTLDNAFQRRWHMRLIPNTFEDHPYATEKILDTKVSWQAFCEVINDEILKYGSLASSEDKRLGAYFVALADLKWNDDERTAEKGSKEYIEAKHQNAHFAEKVLKYLWDDAFKFEHTEVFVKNIGSKEVNSLEVLVDGFSKRTGNKRFDIFVDVIKDSLIERADPSDDEETNEDIDGGDASEHWEEIPENNNGSDNQ